MIIMGIDVLLVDVDSRKIAISIGMEPARV